LSAAENIEEFNVTDFIRRTLEREGWNYGRTVDYLLREAKHNDEFRDALVIGAVSYIAANRTNDAIQSRRAQIVARANRAAAAPNPGKQRGRVIALSEAFATSLFNFPLPGGRKLADASREDIQAAILQYRQQSAASAHKARWLQRVLDAMPAGNVAPREVFTAEDLQNLWTQSADTNA
jgi:hypothetical protein